MQLTTRSPFPRLSLNPNRETDHNYRESDLWIRDAKYLRLKNVEVGYTFKKGICEALRLRKCSPICKRFEPIDIDKGD